MIKGKLISNKKADTIISALMDTWCMSVGFPTTGFFADNSGEFTNIKLDKQTSKLGLTVKFGPAFSPWSYGINERNHAAADLTVKRLMEEKRVPLSYSLVKAAAWTHNTIMNKLGFSPLQLVKGKAALIPRLTTGTIAIESMTDAEAVQRTMENLTNVISEFKQLDMRQKLQDFQKFRTQSYNHTGGFIEGDKVWFQPLNGTFWLGPAAVICQRGQSMWLHTHGDLKKVAAC